MKAARVISIALALTGVSVACSSSKPAQPAPTSDGGPPAPTFEPVSPFVYVGKVKNLLVGLPPTDDEVAAVTQDPSALEGLIGGWMQLPQYTRKMQRFFELAFQQTQVTEPDFSDQAYPRRLVVNASTTPLLLQNLEQSFARTMLALIAEGRPLTVGMTTHKLMMTTALKEVYAFLDAWQVDDAGKVTDRFKAANPGLKLTVGTAAGPIPMAETLDPMSPNYMHWYNPDAATEDATIAGCTADPIVYPASALTLHWLLYGTLDNRKAADGTSCPQSGGSATAPQLTAADFSDWTMVTVRQPQKSETATAFYDLPALRSATELVLSIPRVGFFSTPAFFANWQTNTSNQMRVTMNQTLIVALGAQVDRADDTEAPGHPGLDVAHSTDPSCLACHQTLDPLRSIFAATYSWNYHEQVDPTLTAQKGMFAFRGVAQPVANMGDLGDVLANHPLFPEAWAQKLCAYATSASCSTDDPEFQRVVAAFKSSGLSWNSLVTTLFSSPLVTGATATATSAATGELIAVSRRDHLCAALDARLGFADVCGREVANKKTANIAQLASGLPSDGYGRGAVMPVLPNEPTLFYRAGTENICAGIAAQVIDVAAASQTAGVKVWSSKDPDAAVADFVGIVMGLVPSDPRSQPATDLLKAHFAAAMQQGESASSALKSTFITACLAPSAVSIGM